MEGRAGAEPDLGAWVQELEMGTAPHLSVLRAHLVAFRGPPFSRHARAAVAAAEIRLVHRVAIRAWCGQLQDYLVELYARSPEDAIARVKETLTKHGPYDEFAAPVGSRGGAP